MERKQPCPHFVLDKYGRCENCFDSLAEFSGPPVISKPTLEAAAGLHYVAAYAESDSRNLAGCEHRHLTLCSAVACISSAGGYVVAVERGKLRALNDCEEAEFQTAMHGTFDAERQNILEYVLIMILVKLGFQRYC